MYSFSVICINKMFNFCCPLWIFFGFLMTKRDYYSILKTFVIFFIDRIYCCFSQFLSNQENLYMIYHDSDLFYNIYSTINKHDQRQSCCLLLFWIIFITIFKWTKKLFYNFICFIINHNFYGFTFWMHYMIFIIICGRNKIICYC